MAVIPTHYNGVTPCEQSRPHTPRVTNDPYVSSDIIQAMKCAIVSFALSVPLFVAFPCLAQDQNLGTGLHLQELCSEPKATFGSGYCLGFAHAAVSVLTLDEVICVPDGVTLGEEKKVLVKYLDDHPE